MEGHGAKLTDTSEMEIRKSREISISSGPSVQWMKSVIINISRDCLGSKSGLD